MYLPYKNYLVLIPIVNFKLMCTNFNSLNIYRSIDGMVQLTGKIRSTWMIIHDHGEMPRRICKRRKLQLLPGARDCCPQNDVKTQSFSQNVQEGLANVSARASRLISLKFYELD
jgi:hypothetical protein